MKRSEGNFLITHAGSLPRNVDLVSLLISQSAGEMINRDTFKKAVESSTEEVIQKQKQIGIDIGNNGEQSRISFSTYVTLRMSGFGGKGERKMHKDLIEHPSVVNIRPVDLRYPPRCIGPVHYERLDEVEKECDEFLTFTKGNHAQFKDNFMTAASPGIITLTMHNYYYKNYEDYLLAVTEEMRKEYELIVSKGLILQLDCPDLAMERHISFQNRPLNAFKDLVSLHVKAINQATRNIPPELIRLHVCWGNYPGPHTYDVPLEEILPLLYNAKIGAMVLEMANPRHIHEHRAFRRYPLPRNMLLITGVIDSKTNYVEHPQAVADRIQFAVQAVGDPTRVIAGTDCGFDTSAGMRNVEPSVVWEKLRSLRHGADIAGQTIPW